MSKDYDPRGIPPQWALDMAADEMGQPLHYQWRDPSFWTTTSLSFKALTRRIWRTEEPPVDPMMDIVREAIARAWSSNYIRKGEKDSQVKDVVAYLRQQKADFSN